MLSNNKGKVGIIISRKSSGKWEIYDDVTKWKHFPRYWDFVRGIHRWPVNSPHKGQWRGALMFLLICAWINGCANNREAGDLRRHRIHYDVIVMMEKMDSVSNICSHAILLPPWDKHDITYKSLFNAYPLSQRFFPLRWAARPTYISS